jgi:hypothetical protein
MSKREFKTLIILFSLIVAGIIYLMLGFNYRLNVYDEAIGIYGARSVMNGEIPYRDFWTIYSPGYFYFLAFFLNLLNWHVITERIVTIAFLILPAVGVFFITKKIIDMRASVLAFILTIIWTGNFPFFGKSAPVVLSLALLSIVIVFKYIERRKRTYLFLSGLVTGLTAYFRHEFGASIFGAQILFLIILLFSENTDVNTIAKKSVFCLKAIMQYAAGFLIILIPGIIYLLINVPFDDLYQQLYYVPLKIYPNFRYLPFPFFHGWIYSPYVSWITFIEMVSDGIVFYLIFFIYLITFVSIILNFIRRNIKIHDNQFMLLLLLFLMGITFCSQAFIRSELEHLYSAMVLSFVLFTYLFWRVRNRTVKYFYILMLILLFITPLEKKAKTIYKCYFSKNTYWFKYDKLKGICDRSDWAVSFEQAIDYIKRNVPKNEKIFVGNYYHDRVLLNDMMIYFLTERDACTKYHELHPGVTTTAKVQTEIVNDFIKNKVHYIVLCDNREFLEKNQSRISSRVFILDNYIHNNFVPIDIFGGYEIWRAKENTK